MASGGGNITGYFNYGITEEHWLEYTERQLAVRQELTDTKHQKYAHDPTIIYRVPSRH